MTRKRFVKLLMAQGISRNAANEIAWNRHLCKGGYAEAYEAWNSVHGLSCVLNSSISEMVDKATNAVETLVKAIGASVSAFSSVLTVSLQNPSPFGGVCRRCGGTGVERQMQALAQIGGPSVRGPDLLSICPRCLGTGRELV